MNKINLNELIGGALQEQFDVALETVAENLQNPNTPFKNKRGITIKLDFTQNERRDDVRCAISVETKLAPQAPMETMFAVGKDLKNGQIHIEEYGKQIKGQISMDELPEAEEAESNVKKVIDFRKHKEA